MDTAKCGRSTLALHCAINTSTRSSFGSSREPTSRAWNADKSAGTGYNLARHGNRQHRLRTKQISVLRCTRHGKPLQSRVSREPIPPAQIADNKRNAGRSYEIARHGNGYRELRTQQILQITQSKRFPSDSECSIYGRSRWLDNVSDLLCCE